MGFDFFIQLILQVCPETGKPFYYNSSPEKGMYKEYTLPELNIPEKHRRFLQGRGSIFHVYTHTFNEENIYTVDIDRFLEVFPEWEEVIDSSWYEGWEDEWTEQDHDDFKEALTWFSKQHPNYQATWSY